MGSRWLPRLVVAGAAAGVLAITLATPAQAASTTININSGNVPTTAAAFSGKECSSNLGGGPYADQDVWVFNLPGSTADADKFVSVTATWTTPDVVTKTIPTDGGAIVKIGTSKAYIVTPAGWTLTGASAVVDGAFEFFVLTHTCPAGTSTSPSPSTPGTPSPSDPGTPSPSPSLETSQSPGPSGSTGPSVSPSPSGGLPVTGTAVAGIVTTGLVLLAVGAVLMFMHRRRSLTDIAE